MKFLTFTKFMDTCYVPDDTKCIPISVSPSAIAWVAPSNDKQHTILSTVDGTRHLLLDDYEDVRTMIAIFHT